MSGSLATWLLPKEGAPKRKAPSDAEDSVSISDKENTTPAPKRAKATAKKASAKTAPKPVTNEKEGKKIYDDTNKDMDKRIKDYDKRQKASKLKWGGVDNAPQYDDYVHNGSKRLSNVSKIEKHGSVIMAFNMLMSSGDATLAGFQPVPLKVYGVAGWGDMDDKLCELIDRRPKPDVRQTELPKVKERWDSDKADVGVFETGRPNKQQRGWLEAARSEWNLEWRKARRARRETTEDWVSVALADLKPEWTELESYGTENFFPEAIEKLEKMRTNAPEEAVAASNV